MTPQDKIHKALKAQGKGWVTIKTEPLKFPHYGKPCIIAGDGSFKPITL